MNKARSCLLAVSAAIASASFITAGTSQASFTTTAAASRLVTVTPARILDSRPGAVPDDGVNGVIPPAGLINLQVTGRGGVPASGVTAVVLNVTVIEATGVGFVQVFPTGIGTIGSSSNLNIEYVGQIIPNQVTVPVGNNGQVSIYVQGGGDIAADVFGYFTPAATATAGRFQPASTTVSNRALDTRDPLLVPVANPGDVKNCTDFATWDAAWRWYWTYKRYGDIAKLDGDGDGIPCNSLPGTKTAAPPADLFKLAGGGTFTLGITQPGGGIPSAVVANVTVTEATAPGFWQVLPTGGAAYGSSSNLNINAAGQTASNQVVVPVAADGTITIYTQTGGHVIVDIAGTFTGATSPSSSVGLFTPVTPNRLVDTRDPSNTPSVGPLPRTTIINVNTAGRFGVPAGAAAVALNATITDSLGAGFVQLYPTGGATPGSTSNLNTARSGQTIPNAAYTSLDSSGRFSMYVQAGGNVLADVAGWFSGTGSSDITAASVLATIPTVEEYTGPLAYDRDLFTHWTTQPDGCTTRERVLIRDSTTPAVVGTGCAVTSGTWLSPYDGATWTAPANIDIDHVVALSEAWDSGAYAWTAERRTAYANDLTDSRTLIAVTDTVNAQKSDYDPTQWLPPATSDTCRYIGAWISVKARWGLSADPTEKAQLNYLTTYQCAGLAITPTSPAP
jgi:hypothetical protein